MWPFRDYRLTIPGAILILVFCLTLCAGTGFRESPVKTWFPWLAVSNPEYFTSVVGTIVALLVTNFAGGFLCYSLTMLPFVRRHGTWLLSEQDLERIETEVTNCQLGDGTRRNDSHREVMAEMHLRLHSHAPQTVMDFLTRRLTVGYTAYGSIWAIWIGYLFALAVMARNGLAVSWPLTGKHCLLILGVIFALLTPLLLRIGKQARTDVLDVLIKFLRWDARTNPPRQGDVCNVR